MIGTWKWHVAFVIDSEQPNGYILLRGTDMRSAFESHPAMRHKPPGRWMGRIGHPLAMWSHEFAPLDGAMEMTLTKEMAKAYRDAEGVCGSCRSPLTAGMAACRSLEAPRQDAPQACLCVECFMAKNGDPV